jgi:mRNA interferase MazF
VKRGEIWTVSGAPGYGSKPRPALVVQSDRLANAHSVITCGLTSFLHEMPFRPLIEPSADNSLDVPSTVMVEKLTAISRDKLGKRIGALSLQDMARVEQALLLVLGLAE